MLQDYKLGFRMLLKYPGLTLAGGLALAIAIGIGAGWYDLWGKLLAPAIPLPEGDRLVTIETQNTLTNESEPRLVHDFLEWRRELRTIEDLGAYRTDTRNLIAGTAPPRPIRIAELTAAAFRAARTSPLLGRALLDADESPGAPAVVVLGYDVWQHSFGGREDVIGSIVTLGNTAATVIGVMGDGFRYPVNHHAWAPLQLRASYGPLEGDAIEVLGRLAPGATVEQADAELRLIGERAAARLEATHSHLRPYVMRLGAAPLAGSAQFAMTSLPGLLVLMIACLTVGTLFYARTATREGEIALRSALGASRARIVGQLFVEALVLASIAAVAGLFAADRTLQWGIGGASSGKGGAPFWMTTGLELTTVLYASVLAIVSAVLLSILPALKATRASVQSHLTNSGAGAATLRFGRVWTTAMIAQVALTAIGIPAAMEGASQALRIVRIRAAFPSQEYLAARIDAGRGAEDEAASTFEERRAQMLAELERRLVQEPGVVAVAVSDYVPGTLTRGRDAELESSPGVDRGVSAPTVWPGFFEAFERPIVAGRTFNGADRSPASRNVIVNEAFVRRFRPGTGVATVVGTRLRYPKASARPDVAVQVPWFEIVGVVRDFGLDPDEEGNEQPFVFHAAPDGRVSPLVMNVRVRSNPAALVGRLPVIAADVDAGLYVQEAHTLREWIRQRNMNWIWSSGAAAGVTSLVLFLSAMGIFSLMSVSVSRRRREIGVRAALGASRRRLLAGILTRAVVLVGSGIAVGGALLLVGVAFAGPSGRPADDVAQFAVWLAATAAVMVTACLLACIEPARRALRINAADALRVG